MKLSHALRLQAGDVVAIVGAGGKTSCLRTLMHEAANRTVLATTTNLGRVEADVAPKHIVVESPASLTSILASLEDVSETLFTGPLNDSLDKWTGLGEASLKNLVAKSQLTGKVLVVEADGARRKLFKAPAEHEPALPGEATLVVPVVNIGIVGRALTSDVVHRPDRMATLIGLPEGTLLEPAHIAYFMRHEEGGLKNVPEIARVRVLINGIDSTEKLAFARAVARELLAEQRISSVLLASLGNEGPVQEVWGRIGVVILAAGGSTRFGRPKLVQKWQGQAILPQVVDKVLESGLEPVVVVLGAEHARVAEAIADMPVKTIHNPAWADGQSTSVIAGLGVIEGQCEAILFVLGDMPAITPGVLNDLVVAHRTTLASTIAPQAGGRLGNPVLFDRRTFSELACLEGDRGGRALFDRFPPHPVQTDEGVLFDIDTPEDLLSG